MLSSLSPYLLYLLTAILSAIISMYAVKKTIFITQKKKLYDIPDSIRKIHGAGIPSLGGIGIFTGYVIVSTMFWEGIRGWLPFFLCSTTLLFFTGVYDDLTNMRPSKKLAAQLLASFITVYFADIRMENVFEALGIGEIAYWPSVIITTLTCTFFINVFNFIDGIDGLACALGILYMGILGLLSAYYGYVSLACVCFALASATAGLLFYNRAPAKIYMGDTGSMFLGFSVFILSLLVFDRHASLGTDQGLFLIHGSKQSVILSFAMLLIPIYDGIRVFVLRALKGISPLKADRRHLHYYLLDAGCSHSQAVGVIVVMNILLVVLAWVMQDVNIYIAILGCIVLVSGVVMVVYRMRERKMRL